MADILNLRMARKRKLRESQAADADANRVRHGMSKADRKLAAERETRRTALLDAHRIEPRPLPSSSPEQD